MESISLERLYEYRFSQVDQGARQAVWTEIANHIFSLMGNPKRVLDPAGGRGEFINSVQAEERWCVDIVAPATNALDPGVRVLVGDVLEVELPSSHFDGIFVSNFLEHLRAPDEIAAFLNRMFACQAPNGRLAVLGPNFRYCSGEYFDCADHYVALTHVSVAEHLYAAGYEVERIIPRFLPYSFRSRLPASARLARAYLKLPLAWRVVGKQFLVVGQKR